MPALPLVCGYVESWHVDAVRGYGVVWEAVAAVVR